MPKILVVGATWVGDMVMAQTLFKLLKQQNPTYVIDVLAPNWSLPLLARMPEINQAIDLPFGHGALQLKERYKFAQGLRGKYDEAIVLPNSLKSALIPFWAKISRRIGFRGEMRYGLINDMRILDKAKYVLMIERFMALALAPNADLVKPYVYPKLIIDQDNLQQALVKFNIDKKLPIVALCPGAEFGISKKWPAKYYAQVAQHYINSGFKVFILGSKADVATSCEVISYLPHNLQVHIYNLAGKTSLVDAVDLLSLAELVISNDSGLMHVASAVGCKVVAIYGATAAEFAPPLAHRSAKAYIDLECRPCRKRVCQFGHYQCLYDLSAQQVLNIAQNLIGRC